MARLGRWLRQTVKGRDDDMDWAALGRSFGRWAGGYLKPGDPDPPAWVQGRRTAADETNTPRWAVLLGIGGGVGISIALIGLILWLGTR